MLSLNNTIYVEWTQITGDAIPISGYKLYADSGRNDDFSLVYDGSNRPQITSYTYEDNLDPALTYRFKVVASSLNGDGPESSEASL